MKWERNWLGISPVFWASCHPALCSLEPNIAAGPTQQRWIELIPGGFGDIVSMDGNCSDFYSMEGREVKSLDLFENGMDCPRLPITGGIQHRLASYFSGKPQKGTYHWKGRKLVGDCSYLYEEISIPFPYMRNSSSLSSFSEGRVNRLLRYFQLNSYMAILTGTCLSLGRHVPKETGDITRAGTLAHSPISQAPGTGELLD